MLWPEDRGLQLFLDWFEYSFHSTVVDVCDKRRWHTDILGRTLIPLLGHYTISGFNATEFGEHPAQASHSRFFVGTDQDLVELANTSHYLVRPPP
jgi:hypothetical protein